MGKKDCVFCRIGSEANASQCLAYSEKQKNNSYRYFGNVG